MGAARLVCAYLPFLNINSKVTSEHNLELEHKEKWQIRFDPKSKTRVRAIFRYGPNLKAEVRKRSTN